MRVVTLEEHFTIPALIQRISEEVILDRGFYSKENSYGPADPGDKMADMGAGRVKAMDDDAVTVQVLSYEGPGSDLLPPSDAITFARDANNTLASSVTQHRDRLSGFAHLPLTAPEAAADELQRCVTELGFVGALVNGSTGGLFLDDARFEPLLARAEALEVPIYIHPGIPAKSIRDGYYDGLPKEFSYIFGIAGWGWHVDTAVHILRLVLSGALDRHPRLQLITGHIGEGLPAMLARFDQMFGHIAHKYLTRPIHQTIADQLHVTTSGFVTVPPFLLLLETFGADRIMLSADYPFLPMKPTMQFLEQLPISEADRVKIAHGNADRLLKLKT